MKNAKSWELKESFDNFFNDSKEYVRMRIDDEFKTEMHFVMDQIWKEQISKPSQIYTND